MEKFSDEELVASFRADGGAPAGNRWIDELFSRYHARVGLWCYRFSGDREQASDLAQDVFLRAYRSIGSFRGDSKFSTWLFTIARNHCMNERKARSLRPEHTGAPVETQEIEDALSESVLETLQKQQSLAQMRTLMAQALDDTEKQVMTLHFAQEMGIDAISRLLKLENASGARAYIVSAKRKLSAAMQRWEAKHQKESS